MSLPSAQHDIPIACNPMGIPADEREPHFANAEYLFSSAVQERQALSNGYSFRFRADDYAAVAAFIANERRCCPFFHFDLNIALAQGPLWLQMAGGEGVKAFIQAEFVKEKV